MFGDMMDRLKAAQEKVEATKKRLSTIMVEEKTSDDLLRVMVTANREVRSVEIDPQLLEDREQLEDYLVVTLNKALEKAGGIHEAELAAAAREGMPNIPGMDGMFGK